MLVTVWCNQLRWHQCSSGLPAIIPLTTRCWNRPVGGDDAHDCVSRSNRKWQLKSCRLIAIGPQKRSAALMLETFFDEAELRIETRAGDITGVNHFIAKLEYCHGGTDRFHNAGR